MLTINFFCVPKMRIDKLFPTSPLPLSCSINKIYSKDCIRLQAVPFWIVERSREIAEREKTGANERRGAWGEAWKRGKEKKGTALLAVTDAFRVTPPTIR